MLVVDTSAVIAGLADPSHDAGVAFAHDGDLHAPHLVDVEFQHALRRLVRAASLSASDAETLRRDFDALALLRYPHHPLADRMWALRDNLTAYDAAFVVLSEMLGVPLLTADSRLAGAPGHDAEIRLVRSAGP